MMEEQEINTDALEEVSSEPQVESSEPAESSDPVEQQTQSTEENVPFHKHPRWIERDNELKAERERAAKLERQYAELAERMEALAKPKQPEAEDALIKDLKQIRPEFGERFEQLWKKLNNVDSLEKELTTLRQQNFVQTAVSNINKMHSENKVAPELQEIYNESLDSMYRSGQIKSMDDVTKAYKSIHDRYSKLLDSIRRSEREVYSSTKKQDASVPSSQPKGKAVPSGKPFEFSKDPSEARAQLIKRVLNQAKSETDI